MSQMTLPPVIALHGGCGVMDRASLTPREWAEARQDMRHALAAGWVVMRDGGRAVDAVTACVAVLEDSPHFNAGHGAALNAAGGHELDASVMDGETGAAGAICIATAIRNPVLAARRLMERNIPMMLSGAAADDFAASVGLPLVPQGYFTTPRRRAALLAMQRHQQLGTYVSASEAEKHGTVGAVARDGAGHLAAATSTGGFTNKAVGRVGDSAIIGAGTYARDGVCAISGTGQGEYFIRNVVGHTVASRVAYLHETLGSAMDHVLAETFRPHGVGAGLIAIAADGTVQARFNTIGMFRGWIDAQGRTVVATHGDDTIDRQPAAG
jgi:L-asparaginase / beta-aspartyl-peptidase